MQVAKFTPRKAIKYVSRIPQVIEKRRRQQERALKRIVDRIFEISQDLVSEHSDVGTLQASGYIQKITDRRYKVGYTAPHAEFVEYGTGPQRGRSSYFIGRKVVEENILPWVKRNVRTSGRGKNKVTVIKPGSKKGTSKIRDREALSIAWAIARKIGRYGLRPRPFFRPAVHMARSEIGNIFKTSYRES